MSNVLRTNENLDTVKGRNGAEMPEIPLTFIIKKLSLLMCFKGALKRSLIKKRDHSDTEWPLDILGL